VAAEKEEKKRCFAAVEGAFYSRRGDGVIVGPGIGRPITGGDVVRRHR
jgi:hypothetical protein